MTTSDIDFVLAALAGFYYIQKWRDSDKAIAWLQENHYDIEQVQKHLREAALNYRRYVTERSNKYGTHPDICTALIWREVSAFNYYFPELGPIELPNVTGLKVSKVSPAGVASGFSDEMKELLTQNRVEPVE